MNKIFYGISGTFKSTFIKAQVDEDINSVKVSSSIKFVKSLENNYFKDYVQKNDLIYAINHLAILNNIEAEDYYLFRHFIERGVTDMIYYFNNRDGNSPVKDDIIKGLVDKELGILKTPTLKYLMIQEDKEFIKEKILTSEFRKNEFVDVDDYLRKQEKYIEFTKKYNIIDQEYKIGSAEAFIIGLGLKYTK